MIDISILATKTQIFLGLLLALTILAIACSRNSLPSAQNKSPHSPSAKYRLSERQLTPDELTQSVSQLDQNIDRTLNSQLLGGLYKDRRTPQQKKEINAYIQSWESIDPDIAPFLGRRQIIENIFIYPSLQKGKVCLLQQYTVEKPHHVKGVLFSFGSVNDGVLQTSSNQTIIARNGFLATISIGNNQPHFSLLPHALPLVTPEFKSLPDIKKQFEESQCQFTAPQ